MTDRGRPAEVVLAYRVPGDLAAVRAFVRTAALAGGLGVERVELLVLAVSELATNTLEHTSDGGRVRVRRDGGQVVCEVTDTGALRAFGPMPAADSPRGRGLAIVGQVVDAVSSFTDGAATMVQLRMNT